MSLASQMLLNAVSTSFFPAGDGVVSTIDDHEIVAAQGEDQAIVIDDLVLQAQGESNQTVNVKAGEEVIYGPLILQPMEALTLGRLGGKRLPANTALVIETTVAEDLSISGGYFVRSV